MDGELAHKHPLFRGSFDGHATEGQETGLFPDLVPKTFFGQAGIHKNF